MLLIAVSIEHSNTFQFFIENFSFFKYYFALSPSSSSSSTHLLFAIFFGEELQYNKCQICSSLLQALVVSSMNMYWFCKHLNVCHHLDVCMCNVLLQKICDFHRFSLSLFLTYLPILSFTRCRWLHKMLSNCLFGKLHAHDCDLYHLYKLKCVQHHHHHLLLSENHHVYVCQCAMCCAQCDNTYNDKCTYGVRIRIHVHFHLLLLFLCCRGFLPCVQVSLTSIAWTR